MFNKKAYDAEFNKNAYDRLSIFLPKGAKEIVKQYCLAKGLSINAYISDLILWDIGAKSWKDVLNGKKNDQD